MSATVDLPPNAIAVTLALGLFSATEAAAAIPLGSKELRVGVSGLATVAGSVELRDELKLNAEPAEAVFDGANAANGDTVDEEDPNVIGPEVDEPNDIDAVAFVALNGDWVMATGLVNAETGAVVVGTGDESLAAPK